MTTLRLFVLSLALAVPGVAFADSANELCEGNKEHKEPVTADKSEPKKEQPKDEKSGKRQPEQKPEADPSGKS